MRDRFEIWVGLPERCPATSELGFISSLTHDGCLVVFCRLATRRSAYGVDGSQASIPQIRTAQPKPVSASGNPPSSLTSAPRPSDRSSFRAGWRRGTSFGISPDVTLIALVSLLEQNPSKSSKWARLAREGHAIAWEYSGPGGG
jgi:hypothetical protein